MKKNSRDFKLIVKWFESNRIEEFQEILKKLGYENLENVVERLFQRHIEVTVHCQTCDIVLDSGLVGNDTSLIIFNDFTQIEGHLNHHVVLRDSQNITDLTRQNTMKHQNGKKVEVN